MIGKKPTKKSMSTFGDFGGLSEQEQFELAIKLSLEEEEKNKKEQLLKEKKAPTQEVNQWVKDVTAFSTEYSSWPAKNVCGPSNTYPKYGDIQTCWAPSNSTGTQEYLELLYEKKVVPTRIKVYETYNPGALVKVSGKNPKGNWETLWEGAKQTNKGVSVINEIKFNKVEWLTNEIRLDMDCVGQTSYYEIDAVELFGLEVKLPTTLQVPISFSNFYLNEDFSDFTFVLKTNEEEKIPAHKFILANASAKLHKICQETSQLLVDFPEEDFYTVLKYIYTGRFVLTSKNSQSILKIADKFDIVDLRKSCFDFMVQSLNKDTVIDTLMKAKKKEYDFDATDLISKCIEFIQEKAFDVFPEKTLLSFDKDVMIPLIQGDKLAIDEYDLYESLIKWGKAKTENSKEDLKEFLKDVVCHIRWPLMDSESLYYKVKPGGFISDEQYLEALEYNLNSSLFPITNSQFKKRATVFKGSGILNAKYGSYLIKMLPKTDKTWTLIYKGSQHGFDASQFHKCCDNKGETVVVISTNNGNIFGGYNPVSWSTNGGYTNDSKTFIFTLVNQAGIPPSKLSLMSGKNGAYNASGYSATFGGGHDIYLCSNCQSTNSNYSNFGYSFNSPPGINDTTKKQSLLAGSYNFTVKDVEVFNLQ